MAGMEICKSDGGNSIKDKAANYLFYLGVITEVLLVIIDKSAYINPVEGLAFRLTFLLFLGKVCLTKYSFKEYVIMVFFLIIGSISYFVTERNELVRIVMFLAACKDIDMGRCLKLVFWMTLAGCIGIMCLSLFGIFGTVSLTQDNGHGSVETRYVLGMGHPNALQCMVWALTALGLYLYSLKLRWYHYLMVFIVNVFFFQLSGSKTALIVSIYTIIAFGIASILKKKQVMKLFAIENIGMCLLSVLISILAAKDAMDLWYYYAEGIYSEKARFYSILDKILTGRIHGLIQTKEHEGTIQTWSLFSNPGNDYYFDMGWVRLFYWYGIIPASIAIVVLVIFLIWFCRNNKLLEIVLITVFALYTVVEAHAVSVYIARNYVLFIIGMYWYQLKRE